MLSQYTHAAPDKAFYTQTKETSEMYLHHHQYYRLSANANAMYVFFNLYWRSIIVILLLMLNFKSRWHRTIDANELIPNGFFFSENSRNDGKSRVVLEVMLGSIVRCFGGCGWNHSHQWSIVSLSARNLGYIVDANFHFIVFHIFWLFINGRVHQEWRVSDAFKWPIFPLNCTCLSFKTERHFPACVCVYFFSSQILHVRTDIHAWNGNDI